MYKNRPANHRAGAALQVFSRQNHGPREERSSALLRKSQGGRALLHLHERTPDGRMSTIFVPTLAHFQDMPDQSHCALICELSPLPTGPLITPKAGQPATEWQAWTQGYTNLTTLLQADCPLRYVNLYLGPVPFRWSDVGALTVTVTSPQGVANTVGLQGSTDQRTLFLPCKTSGAFAGTGFGTYTFLFTFTWQGSTYQTNLVSASLKGLTK